AAELAPQPQEPAETRQRVGGPGRDRLLAGIAAGEARRVRGLHDLDRAAGVDEPGGEQLEELAVRELGAIEQDRDEAEDLQPGAGADRGGVVGHAWIGD